MRTKFIRQLEAFVKKSKISKHDIVDAIDFFEKYKRDYKESGLMTSGPCINCGKEIRYKGFSQGHSRMGDGWLWDKIDKWKVPARIKLVDGTTPTIKNLGFRTVELYSCSDCFNELKVRAEREIESKKSIKKYEQQRIMEHKLKFSNWCKESLDSDTVHIADIFTTYINEVVEFQSDPNDQKLPDIEDINDMYYEIVKRYKAYKDNYICKICDKDGPVIVLLENNFLYWNSYAHNNLDSMICICQNCYDEARTKSENGISFGYRLLNE